MKHNLALLTALLLASASAPLQAAADTPKQEPNIVYILADDLGDGDVHCLNPERGKIATPHLDKLAATGMRFEQCHVQLLCTPGHFVFVNVFAGINGAFPQPQQIPHGVAILASILTAI